MFVDFNILNQLGSPSINSNTFANRPAAGQTGRLFVSIDTFEIYRDNGTTWDLIGGPGSSTVTGTGAATQVAYWTAAQAIGGSNNLWWDNTSGFLGVGSNAPTARIEAVKTDGIGIYANYTTNAGSGSSATAIWAKNVTNSSGYGAVIEETTPNTTGGQYPLLIKHSLSSGTAGVGMGTGVHWQLPDDAGTFKTTQLTVETINAAAATYATRYRFNVQSNGSSTPVAYLNATGLGIFTATPGAALDIHSTGTIAQLNSTGTTNNGYLAFQRTGATTFSIGDTYNGGSNYFRIFGSALSADIVRIFAATGESSFTSTETYSSGNSIGVAVQHNLTIPNGVNVGLAALGGVNSNLNLSLGGSTTVANTGRQGLEGSTTIGFTGAGTLTMTQGSTVRAFSALSSVYAFNGSAVGTITHLAGLRICFPDNVGSAVNITNNYALLINNQTTGTGTVTYTNRWGIYQEGASDLNYFAANTLIGSTVNNGAALQVTGTSTFSSTITATGTIQSNDQNAFWLYQPSNPLDTKYWAIQNLVTSGTFRIRALNDTATNGINALTIDRTGISSITTSFPNGNIGIGTSTITNPISFIKVLNISGGDAGIVFSNSNGTAKNWSIGAIDAGSFVFFDGSSERMRITSGGLVGIGTNSPASILHVSQDAPSSGSKITITNTSSVIYSSAALELVSHNGTSPSVGTSIFSTNNNFVYGTISSNQTNIYGVRNGGIRIVTGLAPITFGNGNSDLDFANERMRIVSGGNVLIGTTTDAGQKLQVNGTANATQFNSTSGTVSVPVTTNTTFFTPTSVGLYMAHVYLAGNATQTWDAVIIFAFNATNILVVNQTNSANVSTQISGTDIQVRQIGATTYTFNYEIIKIA